MLSTHNHSRDSAGMKYVYPVISRRAGGVSIGINLNTNNACNWGCIYCQVPNLTRGGPPAIDLPLLDAELRQFLNNATQGDFLEKNAPEEARRLVDVAFSGNGEPTSAREFPKAVEIVANALSDFNLLETLALRVITNGSLLHLSSARHGIARIGSLGGEVWFKIDRATPQAIALVNGTQTTPDKIRKNVLACAQLAPTWVQSCFFAIDGNTIDESEFSAYLDLIASISQQIKGVHVYGLARPSMQPEAKRLSALTAESLMFLSQRIAALGVDVITNP